MRCSFTLLFSFISSCFFGQSLLESENSIPEHFLFQITNGEALELLSGSQTVDTTFFHSLVDTYYADSITDSDLDLDYGHYVDAKIVNGFVETEIFSVHNTYVEVLNNQSDLNIRVMDKQGHSIEDAVVTIKKKRIPYDSETDTYRHKRSYSQGILTIEYKGIVGYYDLQRQAGRQGFTQTANRILYSKPIRYVWKPIRLVGGIPLDGIRSIKHKQALGSIYSFKKPFADVVESFKMDEPEGWVEDVTCFFAQNAWYCEDKWGNQKSYFAFNQPKYRPGDTVRFKAFIVDGKRGKPYKKPLHVYVSSNYSDRKKLVTAQSYRKGAYHGEFVLHDSLELKLDNSYRVFLRDKNDNTIAQGRFEYEDYDLKSNSFSLNTSATNHYKGQNLQVEVVGKDENDLPIYDATVELLVTSVSRRFTSFSDQDFLRDTLFFKKVALNAKQATQIEITDSLFPNANFSYLITANFLNAENERVEKTKKIAFYAHNEQLELELEQDSLVGRRMNNGLRVDGNGTLTGLDKFGWPISREKVVLPFSLELNPLVNRYILTQITTPQA